MRLLMVKDVSRGLKGIQELQRSAFDANSIERIHFDDLS